MRNNDNDGCFLTIIFETIGTLTILFTIIEFICLPFVYAYKQGVLFTWVIPILFAITTALLIYLSIKNNKYKKLVSTLDEEYKKKSNALEIEYNNRKESLEKEHNAKLKEVKQREDTIRFVLKSQTPFRNVAMLAAQMETIIYKKDEYYLKYKPHPAYSAADKIKEIREACRNKLANYKEMQYKYDFILEKFPEIKWYVDNDSELLNIAEFMSYSDLEDNRDRSRDYLTAEEWARLTTTERNQLALDRYVEKRKKSAWAIGRDYEMACAYMLRRKGLQVGNPSMNYK